MCCCSCWYVLLFFSIFFIHPHIFDYADERDCVPCLRVVLLAAQDEGGGHGHVEVEVMAFDASRRRHLECGTRT